MDGNIFQAWWFWAGAAALGMLVVWLVGHLCRRPLAKRKRELEDQVVELQAQLETAHMELMRQSREDSLTGLPNQRSFLEGLDSEWRRLARENQPMGACLIDVDHFGSYNEAHGREASDECLKSVAGVLKGRIRRAGDMCARSGGEEFGVVLSNVSAGEAAQVAEELRAFVEALRISHDGQGAGKWVTVSIGCAVGLPRMEEGPTALLDGAKRALQRSKTSGRNRVSVVDLTLTKGGA